MSTKKTEPTFVYVARCVPHSDLLEDYNRRELIEEVQSMGFQVFVSFEAATRELAKQFVADYTTARGELLDDGLEQADDWPEAITVELQPSGQSNAVDADTWELVVLASPEGEGPESDWAQQLVGYTVHMARIVVQSWCIEELRAKERAARKAGAP